MEENSKPKEETPIVETPVVETPKEEETSLDYKFEHLEFIEDNNIEIDKIPKEIRKKMGAMKMHLGKYKNKPSDASKNTIIKHDITICDMLLTWKEQDYPDDNIETPVVETPVVETPVVETPLVETPPQPKDETENMVAQIKEKLGEGGIISVNDLKSIIRKTPNYPTQIVGNIKLEKMFLKPFYKKI